MEAQLIELGLSQNQAKLYLYLLRLGRPGKPADIANHLKISRTNTYKLLDSLLALNLIRRLDDGATFAYISEDPSALAVMASHARIEAIRLEKQVKEIIPNLKETYKRKHQPGIISEKIGKQAIYRAHISHLKKSTPLYFIRSRFDIPALGFELMHRIRTSAVEKDIERYGLTPDTSDASKNNDLDRKSNLTRTWIDASAYTSSVEWSTCGDELLIVNYSNEGSVISIKDRDIADAFRQLWQLANTSLRKDPEYKKMPLLAKRII